ncbi:MBL fold metallo-hydrolase [Mumia sp. DW29H23]|uniref:MBL fold metallo-hydrolase n=1 Tax=Mumia sp. DW29H23 TaxID=3421241 RepID=UPI003D696F2C
MAGRDAWADVTYETVAPEVHRIPVEMPGEGLAATNVYAVVGDRSVGLVDAGWFAGDAMGDLERGLAALGAGLGDVSTIVVTHIHPDHYTLAVELMRRTGCEILLGSGERHSLALILDRERGMSEFGVALRRCGVPRSMVESHARSDVDVAQYAEPTRWLHDGDVVLLGDLAVEAVETPGHTRGHMCFAGDEVGVLFTGDHVLPRITPAVGSEPTDHLHRSLVDYLDSLTRLRKRPDAAMLPAHGVAGASVHERVDELLRHHEVRLDQCGEAVAAGARTAYEVAKHVPWTKRERALDSLGPMDQLMAVQETRAHLEVLAMQGRVRQVVDPDLDLYALA